LLSMDPLSPKGSFVGLGVGADASVVGGGNDSIGRGGSALSFSRGSLILDRGSIGTGAGSSGKRVTAGRNSIAVIDEKLKQQFRELDPKSNNNNSASSITESNSINLSTISNHNNKNGTSDFPFSAPSALAGAQAPTALRPQAPHPFRF
jgi:hypothetical protein